MDRTFKTSILHILYALFPIGCDRYVEPFGGSGAVLLGKPVPDKFNEVFNDYNRRLKPRQSVPLPPYA